MSQQINLLVRKRSGAGIAWLVLALSVLLPVSQLGLWAVRQGDLTRAQAAEAATTRQLQDAKARLQARTPQSGTNYGAEIEALKPRAEAAQKMLDRVDELGSRQGYGRYFGALASVNEEGLWLSSVTVNKAGKAVGISGHALRRESVLHYAAQLNALFADAGVQFTALELAPESAGNPSAGKPGEPGAALNAVAFKLY